MLTPKQEKFIQGIVSGLSQREAYKQAYNCSKWKDENIDSQASKVFSNPKIRTRYNELMEEHKAKALWTREEAVNELIWIKEEAKKDVKANGLRQANSNAFINAIKELNTLEDLYPKDKKEDKQQEKEIAQALRGLLSETNS